MISLISILKEVLIGRYNVNIRVVIEIDKTKHASERQYRHEDFTISDDVIKQTASKALSKITTYLLHDDIDLTDEFLIQDRLNALNLIGTMRRGNDALELVIITVMKKKNFNPKPGTSIIQV